MASYDVFISYKNTDDDGSVTRDAVMAESLYHALQAKGYNPFFSKYSIDFNGRSDYVTLINNALESAKVFVAVGTSRQNLTSRWVKREINIFSALMMREEEGSRTLLTYRSEDFPVDALPANLADLQSYADEKAVVRFIDVILKNAEGFRNDGDYTEILYAEERAATSMLTAAPYAADPIVQNHMQLKIGDILNDRYHVLALVGKGGTSNVFLALDNRTSRKCAIKEIRKDARMDFPVLWQALQIEMDLLKLLDHPVFPKLMDVIQRNDYLAIIMEYVEGESLQSILSKKGPQEEKHVLNIAKQLGQALDYLHTRPTPIIYRDLKPANILVQHDGSIKIVDFGTARQYKANAQNDTVCLGTLGYAAPEQFGGMGQTDGRTDIYNLGVTLYQLVTGRNPAEPPYEIVPIRQVNSALSPGLEYIIQKCIQKSPNHRFQSAKDLLDALDNIHRLGKRSLFRRSKTPKKSAPAKAPQPQFQRPSGATPKPIVPADFAIPGNTMPKSPVAPAFQVPSGGPSKPIAPADFAIPEIPTPPPPSSGFYVPAETVILTVQEPEVATPVPMDPDLEPIVKKLAALDPEAQQIVRQLIDRLSK